MRSPPPPAPQQQQQQHQQQQQQQHMNYGNPYQPQGGGGGESVHPAFGGFMTDPTAQMGFQVGKSAVMAGQEYVESNVSIPFMSGKLSLLDNC